MCNKVGETAEPESTEVNSGDTDERDECWEQECFSPLAERGHSATQPHSTMSQAIPRATREYSDIPPPIPSFFFFSPSNLSADCVEPSGARLTLLNKALVFLIKPSNSLSC